MRCSPPVNVYVTNLVPHSLERIERLEALKHDGAFKDKNHAKSEERILPIFVQAPKQHGEELKNAEGREKLLLVKAHEVRLLHIEQVVTEPYLGKLELIGSLKTPPEAKERGFHRGATSYLEEKECV